MEDGLHPCCNIYDMFAVDKQFNNDRVAELLGS
jgi:hypothetical protein